MTYIICIEYSYTYESVQMNMFICNSYVDDYSHVHNIYGHVHNIICLEYSNTYESVDMNIFICNSYVDDFSHVQNIYMLP